MSNKVTAVEWLFNEYVDKGHITIEAIEQALAMEKEQIVDAYKFGLSDEYVIGAEQYYNEIYKSE